MFQGVTLSRLSFEDLKKLHLAAVGKIYRGRDKENLIRKLYKLKSTEERKAARESAGLVREKTETSYRISSAPQQGSGFSPFRDTQEDLKRLHAFLEEGGESPEAFQDLIQEAEHCRLRFSADNSKLKHLRAITLSLPAGYSCPMAQLCWTRAEATGKTYPEGHVWAGLPIRQTVMRRGAEFTCFAAANEAAKANIARARWRNYYCLNPTMPLQKEHRDHKGFKALQIPKEKKKSRSTASMVRLIKQSLDAYTEGWDLFRFHDSGDFFNLRYFDAWIQIARMYPTKLFYGYTTSLRFWVKRQDDLPKNMHLIASSASRDWKLITKHRLRYSVVFNTVTDAIKARFAVDVNEYIAAFGKQPFGLLIHNMDQPTYELRSDAMYNQKVILAMQEEQDVYLTSRLIQAKLQKATRGQLTVPSDFRTKKEPWLLPDLVRGKEDPFLCIEGGG